MLGGSCSLWFSSPEVICILAWDMVNLTHSANVLVPKMHWGKTRRCHADEPWLRFSKEKTSISCLTSRAQWDGSSVTPFWQNFWGLSPPAGLGREQQPNNFYCANIWLHISPIRASLATALIKLLAHVTKGKRREKESRHLDCVPKCHITSDKRNGWAELIWIHTDCIWLETKEVTLLYFFPILALPSLTSETDLPEKEKNIAHLILLFSSADTKAETHGSCKDLGGYPCVKQLGIYHVLSLTI